MTPTYYYFLHFLSGLLLTNGVPHFVAGVSGKRFQSPFASPPGVGESPPVVNVWWGFANLAGGCVLLARFMPASALAWIVFGAAVLLAGTGLARRLGKLRAGDT